VHPDYEHWLRARQLDEKTIYQQLYRLSRVERYYGDLERHFDGDRLRGVIEALHYSTEDEARSSRNPSLLPVQGNIRNNLSSYRSAVQQYRRFLQAPDLAAPSAARHSRGPMKAILSSRPAESAVTLADFGFDGLAAVEAIIANSKYRTLQQAIASLSVFSHPETVRQTGNRALFPTVRDMIRRGQYSEIEGVPILLDDNRSPTQAFLWSNVLRWRGNDTQFNHVYPSRRDPTTYTALPNIFMTPAFLAKLTDKHPEVRAILRYRSFDLYGWFPPDSEAPEKPSGYDELDWAPTLPAVQDVKATLLSAMSTKPADRTVLATRRLGWLFGEPVAV
jgi:hypothetical protein